MRGKLPLLGRPSRKAAELVPDAGAAAGERVLACPVAVVEGEDTLVADAFVGLLHDPMLGADLPGHVALDLGQCAGIGVVRGVHHAARLAGSDIAELADDVREGRKRHLRGETGGETEAGRVEARALVVVRLFIAREVGAQVHDGGGRGGPHVIELQGTRHAVLVGAGGGIMEIVAAQLVFVVPAHRHHALVVVVPALIAASADVRHLILAAGGRREIVGIRAGAIAGRIGQRHVGQDALRHLTQLVGGDLHAGVECARAFGIHRGGVVDLDWNAGAHAVGDG